MDRKPMTYEQLRAITQRRRNDRDVTALLWEIKRMREVLLKAHDYGAEFFGYIEEPHMAFLHDRYIDLLRKEPVVVEREQRQQKSQVGQDISERDLKRAARAIRG